MQDLKSLFLDASDELAEKIGKALAEELQLKPARGYKDRYQLLGGTFTNKGLARRIARIYIETKEKE